MPSKFGDVHVAAGIDGDVARPEPTAGRIGRQRMHQAIGRDHAHAIVAEIGEVEISGAVGSHAIGSIELGSHRQATVAFETRRAVPGDCRDEPIGSDLADAMGIGVGNEDIAGRVNGDALGVVERGRDGWAAITHRARSGHGLNDVSGGLRRKRGSGPEDRGKTGFHGV
jgi:hypothetical protein